MSTINQPPGLAASYPDSFSARANDHEYKANCLVKF